MATATTATTRPSRSKALWFGVLAGPVLWGVQFYVNYQWEEVLACSASARDRGVVLGLGVRTWVVLVNTVVCAVILAALAVSFRCYRRTTVVEAGGVRTSEHYRDVAHWMAFAGIANSILFLLLVVGGYAPAIVLKTCQTVP
jgi:hypothetical protein